ncbi:hypothetical protein HELRODRAFT_105624 [Helobdella robusta]|uniref:protein-tyrosine-phosphatase n=1 Tax=Helobdella robusta TaxID=6412 RepID=T1EDW7_HELRO|nr:hypothetical protein HELRODRAFT_105624 [Helobdella robusta]ESO12928.1 hypothetical protein HELRODRAFT_105624 [Helobdella robusta]
MFSKADCLFVLYDDDTVEVDHLNACSSMKIIYDKLLSLNKRVKYLKGGMKEFLASQSNHCSDPLTNELQPLLFSPTSPYIDTAIDTAIMTEILPYLYLGNEKDASDIDRLRLNNITHVLNVTSGIPMYCDAARDISGRRLPASDSGSQNIKQYFDEAIKFIESARQSNGRVLIHCQAGVSRSPTITMAYLMAKFSWSYMQAFNEVKKRRSIISPNINFLGQLLEFESRAVSLFSSE